MYFLDLSEWLDWIKSLHSQEMDLGLERVKKVGERLNLLKWSCPIVTVGGTNGKGSCVAGLEAVYLAQGYKVGAFTSPFLFRYNEQVRIQGKEVADDVFCLAFERVAEALGEVTLTPFEFGTLAAFVIFQQEKLDVMILEVGLGGRLDAVNIVDADVAVITSVAIDHAQWLGNTREQIALEKAGIFRSDHPAVCGDFDPPKTLIDYAKKINAPLFCQNQDFGFIEKAGAWNWWSTKNQLEELALPSLALQNMASVLMVIELLQSKLPVTRSAIEQGLKAVNLPARIQVIKGEITQIFDVSHNPAAAAFLKNKLKQLSSTGKTHAVFSMLGDKDIAGTINEIKECIDDWHCGVLTVPRAASQEMLLQAFHDTQVQDVVFYSSVSEAYQGACQKAVAGERIIIFGSFHTVAEAAPLLFLTLEH